MSTIAHISAILVALTFFISGCVTATAAFGPRPFEPLWFLSKAKSKPADESSSYLKFWVSCSGKTCEPIAQGAQDLFTFQQARSQSSLQES